MVVHVVICSLDYKGTSCPLTCTYDGNNMQELLKKCDNVGEVKILYDNDATSENAAQAIREIGSICDPGEDYFLFYYSGHGALVPDKDGDEVDGKDEALCFMGPSGELSAQYFMSDDEFAELCTSSFQPGTRMLILTDCCHSGTIGDLGKPCWNDFKAITITGCLDEQTSGDMGKGGIFTHSLLLAIDKLDNHGRVEYSVGQLYKATVKEDDAVFHSKQHITINASSGCHPGEILWPLLPNDYDAPLNGALGAVGAGGTGLDFSSGGGMNLNAAGAVQQVIQTLLAHPEILQQFNINPGIVQALGVGMSKLVGAYAKKSLGRCMDEGQAEQLFDGAEQLVKMGSNLMGRWLH